MGAAENLLSNIDKTVYNTYFDAEKVVKTFTGSFLYGTSTVTRSYTLAGFPNNVQVFKLAHGFTRPLFVELFWSVGGIEYTPGGSGADSNGNLAIAYCDSSFIYIMPSVLPNGTRVFYQIVCSWITDYDTANPSIPAFAEIPDTFTQTFNSRAIIPTIVKQGTISSSTSSIGIVDVFGEVSHGLSYAPDVKIFIESFSGEVWPLNHGGATNPYLIDDGQVEAQVFMSTSKLVTDVLIKSANGQRKLWYMIYGKSNRDSLTGGYNFGQFAV